MTVGDSRTNRRATLSILVCPSTCIPGAPTQGSSSNPSGSAALRAWVRPLVQGAEDVVAHGEQRCPYSWQIVAVENHPCEIRTKLWEQLTVRYGYL